MVGVLKLHSVFDKFLRYPALCAARRALTKFTCVYKFCGNKLHDVACVDFNVLFEPDESQIPMVMDRIFMEYYKKCDRRNFIPRYEYRSILEDKDGDVKKPS